MTNTKFIDAPLFDKKSSWVVIQLCFQAYVSRLLYAYGNLMFGISSTDLVYGAAQFTWDLYDLHCKECLNVAISEFLNQSHGMRGGHVYYEFFLY